ncbi:MULTISPECIES: NAD-dependent epimerase/dehydratase family protein [unclassified Guyparkeria]|uniref:NAD-dependent epimerase/dehydratase family protein n=1 Tax=unclassified Guyparkeria TaxID=2626246 RepID=UPI0008266D5F|nr:MULTISPECIES: NAD-dependent epimerase/dehydratase family protein [unclassified Guyparkeria]
MSMNWGQVKRVLVVGGSGFVGRHLIEGLLAEGMTVRCLDLQSPAFEHESLESVEGSFTEPDVVEWAMDGCDAVYHLASSTIPKTSNEDPVGDVRVNLVGTLGLLDAASRHRIRKFVFISSGGTVYGKPESLPVSETHPTEPICSYGVVKLSVEKYLQIYRHLHGLETCAVRLSNPYGPHQSPHRGQGVIAAFCYRALQGEAIQIWGDGSVVRDYVHIDDVVSALLAVLSSKRATGVINVGAGRGHSLLEVIDCVERACGPVQKEFLAGRSFDVPAVYLDITRARRLLEWVPRVELKNGVGKLAQVMRSEFL